jgi:SAM-dependent methyltransferase
MDPYEAIVFYYDLEHTSFEDDVQFYLNHVMSGPVLEIGAGTGRITRALANAGHEVWAVDSSPAMLHRAHEQIGTNPRVHLVESSVDALDEVGLPAHFRVAILSLNFLWHLPSWEDQLRALQAVHRLLVPMGLLLVDSSNPLTMVDRGARGEVRRRFRVESDGQFVTGFSAAWDDPAEQVISLTLTYDTVDTEGTLKRIETDLDLRYVYRFELELLLRAAGFIEEQLYGSYELDSYSAESPNLISVSRAQ